MYSPTQRLLRSRSEKIIAGVAGGVAQYLAVDPVLIRLAFIALCFAGVGFLLYPILWIIMPLEAASSTTSPHASSEASQVYVAHGSSIRNPRFDPMTGEPLEPEEIPINNVNTNVPPTDPAARRNQLLGYALLIVGAFVLLISITGISGVIAKVLFPAILIGVGVYMLRRNT